MLNKKTKNKCETKKRLQSPTSTFVRVLPVSLATVLVVLGFSFSPTTQYSDGAIADAIFLAEGKTSNYPYGILSVSCDGEEDCRQVCLNTIRNSRQRFADIYNSEGDFIHYLSTRYCPIGVSNDPDGLNANWLGNVKYFLERG